MKVNKKYLLAAIILLVLAGSFLAGWYAKGRCPAIAKSRSFRIGQYKLTNPLLTCENGPNELTGNLPLASLKEQVEQVIARYRQSGSASDISVYFSDLNNDNTIEVNGGAGFEPASLIKLPLMMEYFKRAESDPVVLTKKLTYDGKKDWTLDQNYRPQKTLEPGKSYTVDELIFRMIANSDNNAFRTLLTAADRRYLQEIHNILGVETVADASGARLVTARSYAIFLKTLYNASYLNQMMSERALKYLTANDFHLGIDATIPDSITVASKFGERTTGDNGEIKQLHDYGIVYYPNRPYLVCIMTKGTDFLKLTEAIREISKLVFVEYDARYRLGGK
jgi:beta-lactamase class A